MTERRPSRRLLLVWILTALTVAGVLTALPLLLWPGTSMPEWIARLLAALWIAVMPALCAAYFPLRFHSLSFGFEQNRLCIKTGVLFRSEKTVAPDSIRHIILLSHPLERLFSIGSLVVYTAGGLLLIEGMPLDDARILQRQLLAEKTEAEDG